MTKITGMWCFIIFTVLTLSRYAVAYADDPPARDCISSFDTGALPRYAAGKLDEMRRIIASFPRSSISTKNEEESLYELIRILKTTQSSYHAINYYVFGWNDSLEFLYRTNVGAVKRGIEVTRTFIVSEETLHNATMLENLLSIMATQNRDGIKVYYGLHRDLISDAQYHQYAMIDAGLSDGVVLAQVKAVSIHGPQPAYLDITWDREILKKKNPFPFLKNNPRIYPYNEAAQKKLRSLAGAPAPAQ
ncbi:MAG: hypothetical protein NTX06_12535 [Proteobacteria bacterium]|nr:hypothetical protein [Pseudomonadota bacterium]